MSKSVDDTPSGSWELDELMLAGALTAMRCLSPGGLAHLSTRLFDAQHHERARPTLTTCCSLGAAPRHRSAATAAEEGM